MVFGVVDIGFFSGGETAINLTDDAILEQFEEDDTGSGVETVFDGGAVFFIFDVNTVLDVLTFTELHLVFDQIGVIDLFRILVLVVFLNFFLDFFFGRGCLGS